MSSKSIGVLALQGAFAKHISKIQELGIEALEVRRPEDLEKCDGLIIPGGESTTMARQLSFAKFDKALKDFGVIKPIFGTCAGMIIMATKVADKSIEPFSFIDIEVERNGYGRQVESFSTPINANLDKTVDIEGVFIRAPRIISYGSDVRVLAEHNDEPVVVQQGRLLACSFHPELTNDLSCHKYFISLINQV